VTKYSAFVEARGLHKMLS